MNQNPLVSIVTPVYNMDYYIEETIESVLSQDYKKIEYFIINDGSSDDTQKILEKYKGKYGLNIMHQKNMGQARTLNRGWMLSKGDYIGYLSADDLLKKNAISNLVDKIKNTNLSVVYPDFELIDANSRYIRTVRTEDFNFNRLTLDLVCQPGPGALFQKKIFDALGGWNETLLHVADFEFWLRVAKVGDFSRVPEVLASFRIHEGSGSVKKVSKDKSDEIVKVMQNYWAGSKAETQKISLATAKIISARSHAQSGRYANALHSWLQGIIYSPKKGLSYAALKLIFSGLIRRMFYRLNNIIK
jgi:glycosyltransferase involved in cell wall biosynthesis